MSDRRPQRLHELLGALGTGAIDRGSFWKRMAEAGLADHDIDEYCRLHGGWTPGPDQEDMNAETDRRDRRPSVWKADRDRAHQLQSSRFRHLALSLLMRRGCCIWPQSTPWRD